MYQAFKIKDEEINNIMHIICNEKSFNYPEFEKFFNNRDRLYFEIIDKIVKERRVIESIIDGSKIEADCFPTKELGKFDVFISHSHKDIKLVKEFAGWLEKELGLRCFIDTTYWVYVIDLLKKIDNIYSLKSDGHYDYDKRNYTTANLYIMLSMALMKMIDQTECIIFVETNNSVKNGITLSPWIYEELSFINKLRVKVPARWRGQKTHMMQLVSCHLSGLKLVLKHKLQFKYGVNIDNLTELSKNDFINVKNKNKKGVYALDYIYKYAIINPFLRESYE